MGYYHVLIQYREDPEITHCAFTDLSERDLKARFVRPYLRGERIQSGADVIDVMEVVRVRVIETKGKSDEERARIHEAEKAHIDRINREPNGIRYFALAGGYDPGDIADAGQDVTTRFISAAPGSDRGNVIVRAIHNPWIVGIGVAVLSAVVLVWLGLSGS